MSVELGLLIAIIGCFVGLAGWLSGRDKKISDDAEWKGMVNTKLNTIQDGVSGIGKEVTEIKKTQSEFGIKLENHETRITALEVNQKEHIA